MKRPQCKNYIANYLTTLIWVYLTSSCAINFELTSQRTALENQILGQYEEHDDELYMISSVRSMKSAKQQPESLEAKANRARQNQIFNKDDIEELKAAQILGETYDGSLTILPPGVGLSSKATTAQLKLASLLIQEENHDRKILWQRTIAENDNLKQTDLAKVRQTYAQQIYDEASPGHWFLQQAGSWKQKPSLLQQVPVEEK